MSNFKDFLAFLAAGLLVGSKVGGGIESRRYGKLGRSVSVLGVVEAT